MKNGNGKRKVKHVKSPSIFGMTPRGFIKKTAKKFFSTRPYKTTLKK